MINSESWVIYHNPQCSKSRSALAILQEHQINPEIRLYLEHPPTTEEFIHLVETLLQLSSPLDVIRKGEELYQQLHLHEKNLTSREWGEIIHRHPQLLERPIVIKNNSQAVIARPPELVTKLL